MTQRHLCAAGREADFGGRWVLPCSDPMEEVHWLHTETSITLTFCRRHMQQLIDAGLVPHTYVTPAEIGRLTAFYREHPGRAPG